MATDKQKVAKEKMLYELYLDLCYAEVDYEAYVEEQADCLKATRTAHRKTKKRLAKVKAEYVALYGREPMKPRGCK